MVVGIKESKISELGKQKTNKNCNKAELFGKSYNHNRVIHPPVKFEHLFFVFVFLFYSILLLFFVVSYLYRHDFFFLYRVWIRVYGRI